MEKSYVTRTGKKPGRASQLFKRISQRNSEIMKNKTVEEHRDAQHLLADIRPKPPVIIKTLDVTCGGIPCEWVWHGTKAHNNRVILYLHGGSWAYGNLKTARAVGVMLAEDTKYRVLMAQYRLSPEHRFPAGFEDCYTIYCWLLENGYAPEQIGLFGDSAGGNLCLCILNRLKAEGKPLPSCVCCASPVTDMRETSAIVNSGENLIYAQHNGVMQDIFSLYLKEGDDRADPYVSPVTADLSGLPPILIHTGGDESLAADNEAYADRVFDQGGTIRLKIWDEMFHDFTIVGYALTESRESLMEIKAFFETHMR